MMTPPQREAFKRRELVSRQVMTKAREWIVAERYDPDCDGSDGRLEPEDADAYLKILQVLTPDGPVGYSEESCLVWERAVRAMREKAIRLYIDDHAYCIDGLNDFLEAAGLAPY